jgi:hypothetical protein
MLHTSQATAAADAAYAAPAAVAACPPGKALNFALDACSIKCSKGTFQDGMFLACIPCSQGQTSVTMALRHASLTSALLALDRWKQTAVSHVQGARIMMEH